MSIHKIMGIGNLTRTPELRFLANNTPVITCSVAVNDSYQKDGETVNKVIYWDCEFYGTQAENVAKRNYEKGFKVYFEGRPELGTREDKASGGTRLTAKVKFPMIEKISGKTGAGDFHVAPDTEDEPVVAKAKANDEVF